MPQSPSDPQLKLVKMMLTEQEHRLLRLAAADQEKSLGEFAREATIASAKRVIHEFIAKESTKD